MRTLLAMALIGTMLPVGAFAQEKRYCVDFVARGHLQSVGEPEQLDIPDAVIVQSIYRFRFDKRDELYGHMSWRSTVLMKAGHGLRPVDQPDAVVYIGRWRLRTQYFGDDLVWRDTNGRAFIPIFDWPNPEDPMRWIPQSIRQFAKPVDYPDRQGAVEIGIDAKDAIPGLIETRDGRTRVLFGLYLDDIPAMMKAARSEPCKR